MTKSCIGKICQYFDSKWTRFQYPLNSVILSIESIFIFPSKFLNSKFECDQEILIVRDYEDCESLWLLRRWFSILEFVVDSIVNIQKQKNYLVWISQQSIFIPFIFFKWPEFRPERGPKGANFGTWVEKILTSFIKVIISRFLCQFLDWTYDIDLQKLSKFLKNLKV